MIEKLFLLEREDEYYGRKDEPMLLTEDELLDLAREYDSDIDESVLIDAVETALNYQVTKISSLEDIKEIFADIKSNYMNF